MPESGRQKARTEREATHECRNCGQQVAVQEPETPSYKVVCTTCDEEMVGVLDRTEEWLEMWDQPENGYYAVGQLGDGRAMVYSESTHSVQIRHYPGDGEVDMTQDVVQDSIEDFVRMHPGQFESLHPRYVEVLQEGSP